MYIYNITYSAYYIKYSIYKMTYFKTNVFTYGIIYQLYSPCYCPFLGICYLLIGSRWQTPAQKFGVLPNLSRVWPSGRTIRTAYTVMYTHSLHQGEYDTCTCINIYNTYIYTYIYIYFIFICIYIYIY